MPARHDLLVGALDFPWRPWGSIEIWEDAITHRLRRDAGVSTMLVSDHPHLFETGGENYHADFGAWEYLRGHEGDVWRTRADPSWVGAPALPAPTAGLSRGYDTSRTWFTDEADFPGPRTMVAAARWLDGELSAEREPHERALLVVDEFDPHEPFDVPEPWASRYDPDWEGERHHLAAVRREPGALRALGARGAAPPPPVRRQALDDRPLARTDPRGARPPRRLGHHRGGPLHRPRPLPGRARRLLGEAAGAGAPRARPHPAAGGLAGRGAGHQRRADHHRRPPRHALRRVRRRHRAPHPRRVPRPAARGHRDLRPGVGAVRRLGAGGPRRRRHPHLRPDPGRGQPPAVDVLQPLVDDAGPLPSRTSACPAPTTGPGSIGCPAPTCR